MDNENRDRGTEGSARPFIAENDRDVHLPDGDSGRSGARNGLLGMYNAAIDTVWGCSGLPQAQKFVMLAGKNLSKVRGTPFRWKMSGSVLQKRLTMHAVQRGKQCRYSWSPRVQLQRCWWTEA